MKGFKIGKMDKRITVRSDDYVRNAYGEDITTEIEWPPESEPNFTVFAAVEYTGTKGEKIEGGKEQARDKVNFTIRNSTNISFNKRSIVQFRSNDYDIEYIEEIGRNKYYKIHTTRVH